MRDLATRATEGEGVPAAGAASGFDAGVAHREALELALLSACIQSRCATSFEHLYQLTGPRVLRVILRINRNRADADEILQDVFVGAWLRCAQYDPRRGSAMAWLASMAHHRAVSSLRYRSSRLKSLSDSSLAFNHEHISASIPSEALQPPELTARARAARAVHEHIDALPREHRFCIVLAFFNGLTHAEIALRVGRPVGTVKSWLRRSLLNMRPGLAAH